ncbi:high mobility group b protein 3 [Quercus suber]|uniref:High mobility group b protein 3 n=1 Tax=Quercus suber TaxID=58331 RepID=A0AAW0J7H4_QUESU
MYGLWSIGQDKAPYVAKAEKRKTEYNKTMQAYNKKLELCLPPCNLIQAIKSFVYHLPKSSKLHIVIANLVFAATWSGIF